MKKAICTKAKEEREEAPPYWKWLTPEELDAQQDAVYTINEAYQLGKIRHDSGIKPIYNHRKWKQINDMKLRICEEEAKIQKDVAKRMRMGRRRS